MSKNNKKLRKRYRLVLYTEHSFEAKKTFKISRLKIYLLGGFYSVFIIATAIALLCYTDLREFIPGFPNEQVRKDMVYNAIRADSLEQEFQIRDQFFNNIKAIMQGDVPEDIQSAYVDTTIYSDEINYKSSLEDSILRKQIEQEEKHYNIQKIRDYNKKTNSFQRLHFFPPIKGMVTNKFNSINNHFGTDIVAPPNEKITATLSGTIILATWTLETGNIIQIQHENNLISVYKHLAEVFKEQGNYVEAGEAIAIIGNSGEFSTGTHLHFELWHNGVPVNPEDYILFNTN